MGLVVLFARSDTLREEVGVSFFVVCGLRELSAIAREISLGLAQRSLERLRIDRNEQVALLYVLAFLKMDTGDSAVDLRSPKRLNRPRPCRSREAESEPSFPPPGRSKPALGRS
jgi:hypothetical protein